MARVPVDGNVQVFPSQKGVWENGLGFFQQDAFFFVSGREVADYQLSYCCIACYSGCLCSSGMEGFLGSGCIALCKGAFVEKQVHTFNLGDNAWQADGIGTNDPVEAFNKLKPQ